MNPSQKLQDITNITFPLFRPWGNNTDSMKHYLFILAWLPCLPTAGLCQPTSLSWDQLVVDFCEGYDRLDMGSMGISYSQNLGNIQNKAGIAAQRAFFDKYQDLLEEFDRSKLSVPQQFGYDLIDYQAQLNQERIALEEKWRDMEYRDSGEGLAYIPMGKEWYAYFLKKWIDLEVSPDELYDFGLKQVEKVKSKIRLLLQKSGMDSLEFARHLGEERFFLTEVAEVQEAFESYHAKLTPKLQKYFPGIGDIPPISIARNTDERLSQAPGFYRNNTFFYTKFEYPFNTRQICWLYMHEALPGHHYERSYSATLSLHPVQDRFWFPCYAEGWAAYVEEIGKEIGAYEGIYDELGKWEWDLIRSVRVPMDVGLNFYGWDDEKALEFWKKHIQGQDDIGRREIARMKRWPAQVITYKYGAELLLKWKSRLEKNEGYSLKAFHEEVLRRGPMPWSMLEKYIFSPG